MAELLSSQEGQFLRALGAGSVVGLDWTHLCLSGLFSPMSPSAPSVLITDGVAPSPECAIPLIWGF